MEPLHRVYHQYSRHLTGAILPDEIDFYREYPQLIPRRFPTLQERWFVDISSGKARGITIAPWLESHLRTFEPSIDSSFQLKWDLTWGATMDSLQIQIAHLTEGLSHSDSDQFLTRLASLQAQSDMIGFGKTKVFMINIHEDIELKAASGVKSFRLSLVPTIELIGNLVVLHGFPGDPIMIPYQFLANTLDKLEGQFSHQFYMRYMELHPSRAGLESFELYQQVYQLLEEAYLNEGNEAIRVAKLLEPLFVGAVLQTLPADTNDHQFGDITRMSLALEHPALQPYVDGLWDIATNYLRRHGELGIPILIEQFGQEKLHNYPVVSTEAGLLKMYKYGTEARFSDETALRNLVANFKREYFVAYYEKNGVLPDAMQHFRMDPRIKQLYDQGKPGSIRECFTIPNEAWFNLEYEKNHEFNYYPQVSDLLDDKAITPHLSHIYQLFAIDAIKVMGLSKPKDPENTRLIIEILSRDVIDIREFYEVVERTGSVPTNWAVIQGMAKEKELKIEARVFSILTFECRMMASACERNLKENIMPLFKHQSVTLSGSELKHKMDVLTTLPETEETVWVVFHHDLKQWNYTFRSYQQALFACVLGDLHGVKHYSYLMCIFTNALLISANKFTPPGMPKVFTCWSDHAGGNQGILQCFWSLMTMMIICSVMRVLDKRYRLNGSGDNQVLFVELAKGPGLKDEITRIRLTLKQYFEEIGLELKELETWTSSLLVCYQRKYYFRGVLIPGGVKLSARAFSGTGDISTGVNSTVTTGMNGGVGLTDQHSDPILGPAFSYVEVLLSLLGNARWAPHVPLERTPLTLLTFLTSDFGFLPFMQLSNFLYAGHQDTLTETLALLSYVWDNLPNFRGALVGISRFRKGKVNAESNLQLVLEPTALNIDRPRLPEALVRDKVESYLTNPNNVRNIQLKTMFACSSKADQLALAEELLKIRPINVALIHSLFEYSHIGSLLGTLSRFNRISSLVRLVELNKVGDKEKNLIEQVKDMDTRNLRYFFRRMKPQEPTQMTFLQELVAPYYDAFTRFCGLHSLHPLCSFSVRVFLVSETYGLGDELVTGPYTPSPAEQLIFLDKGLPINMGSTLVISPSHGIPDKLSELELKRGNYSLYIGSRTADPVRSVKLTTLDGVEAGTAIRTLLKILAWMKSTGSDQNVLSFIMQQLGSRMEGLADIIPGLVPGTAGGCIDHRFGSPGTVMWAFSSSTSVISTWYQISSNRAVTLQRGEEDRFIFFQQLYHHIYGALRFCSPYKIRVGATIRLDHCSYPIPGRPFSSPPIVLPGLDKLHSGLVLDEDRKVALKNEAIHFTEVMKTSALHQGSGVEILGGVIGFEVAKQVHSYSIGLEDLTRMEHQVAIGQSGLNLTVVRKVPMNRLLSSIALHLALFGCFGPKLGYDRLLRELRRRGATGDTTHSAHPFIDVIQGIITAGLLPQLITYSGSNWKWGSDRSLVHLLGPLFAGMYQAIKSWPSDKYRICLIQEVKKPSYHYGSLLQFLENWHPKLRSIIQANKSLDPIPLLSLTNSCFKAIRVVLVTDVGIATEYGRRIEREVPQAVTEMSGGLDRALIAPNYLLPASRPWIHTQVEYTSWTSRSQSELQHLVCSISNWRGKSGDLTRLMRWNKSSSSGRHKLAEMLARCSVTIPEESVVITLAEGAGSFLSFLLHLKPSIIGIYNDLVHPDNIPPAMAATYVPPELLCPCLVLPRVINLPELSGTFGDLTNPDTWVELSSTVTETNRPVGVVTMDAALSAEDLLQVLTHLSGAVKTWHPDSIIIKVMLESINSGVLSYLATLTSSFSRSNWIKPVNSNPYSKEVYLVCTSKQPCELRGAQLGLDRLLVDWTDFIVNLTPDRVGRALCDGSRSAYKTNHCPSNWDQEARKSVVARGTIVHIIGPLLLHLIRATFFRYQLGYELDRTEQVMLHSQSKLSSATKLGYQSVTKALSIYLECRGLVPGQSSREGLRISLRKDPSFLFAVLTREFGSESDLRLRDATLLHLGLLLSGPDYMQTVTTQAIVRAWLWMCHYEDRFSLFPPSIRRGLDQLYNTLTGGAQGRSGLWMDCLFRPSHLSVSIKALEFYLRRRDIGRAIIRAEEAVLDEIVLELPWPPHLSDPQGIKIVLLLDHVQLTDERRGTSSTRYIAMILSQEGVTTGQIQGERVAVAATPVGQLEIWE